MHNISLPNHKLQAFFTNDFYPLQWIQGNPELYFKRLPRFGRHLLDILFNFADIHKRVYPSEHTLALKMGCTDRTVRNWLTRFRKEGILATYQRYNDSLLYKVSSFFEREDIRSRLYGVFWAFGSAILSTFRLLRFSYNDLVRKIKETTEKEQTKEQILWERLTSMKQHPISYYVRTQKILKLSLAGQVRLCAFADEAIEYAFKAYEAACKAKDIHSPYSYIFKIAAHYCDDNGIRIDWGKVIELSKAYDLQGNENPLEQDELTIEQVMLNGPKESPSPVLSGMKAMEKKAAPEIKPLKRESTKPSDLKVAPRKEPVVLNEQAYQMYLKEFSKFIPAQNG